jgi:hypothetical protein
MDKVDFVMQVLDRYLTMYEVALRYEQLDTAKYFLNAIKELMED